MAVLEGIASYKTSKVIGRELNISPHTVDQRARKILVTLGVQSRNEAAALFQAAQLSDHVEAGSAYQRLLYQSPDIPPDYATADKEARSAERDPVERGGSPDLLVSVLSSAREENRLSALSRLLAIAGIMVLSVLFIAAMVSLAEGLSRVF